MHHWISCPKFTVQVNTDDAGRITFAASFVRAFVGQPLEHLLRWARKFGDIKHESWLDS